MIPIQLDAPHHTPWRRHLAQFFSPKQMAKLRPKLEERTRELVAEIKVRGECDYVADFALQPPTVVFLELKGLPVDRKSVVWGKSGSVRVEPGGRRSIQKKRQERRPETKY